MHTPIPLWGERPYPPAPPDPAVRYEYKVLEYVALRDSSYHSGVLADLLDDGWEIVTRDPLPPDHLILFTLRREVPPEPGSIASELFRLAHEFDRYPELLAICTRIRSIARRASPTAPAATAPNPNPAPDPPQDLARAEEGRLAERITNRIFDPTTGSTGHNILVNDEAGNILVGYGRQAFRTHVYYVLCNHPMIRPAPPISPDPVKQPTPRSGNPRRIWLTPEAASGSAHDAVFTEPINGGIEFVEVLPVRPDPPVDQGFWSGCVAREIVQALFPTHNQLSQRALQDRVADIIRRSLPARPDPPTSDPPNLGRLTDRISDIIFTTQGGAEIIHLVAKGRDDETVGGWTKGDFKGRVHRIICDTFPHIANPPDPPSPIGLAKVAVDEFYKYRGWSDIDDSKTRLCKVVAEAIRNHLNPRSDLPESTT